MDLSPFPVLKLRTEALDPTYANRAGELLPAMEAMAKEGIYFEATAAFSVISRAAMSAAAVRAENILAQSELAASGVAAASEAGAVRRLYAGGREYIVADAAKVAKVKEELASFYEANKPLGARLSFGNIADGNGFINTVRGDILISKQLAEEYPHLLDAAILEELLHFKQLYDRGWLGRALTEAENALIEAEVVTLLLEAGLKELY